jgi:hypothetical protein
MNAVRRVTAAAAESRQPPELTMGYAAALIELCGRIGRYLERFGEAAQRPVTTGGQEQLLWVSATLRLELTLLLESSSSARWRPILSDEQGETLRSLLTDVLDIIAVTPGDLTSQVIESAQDRLFDEVLAQRAAVLG